MSRLQEIRLPSLPQQICRAFCDAVANGHFLPGERLVEGDLARELGVSRIPVREALRLLESQGLVVNEPYKGMRLMAVSTQDCRQRFIVYRALALEALRIIVAAPIDQPRWQDLRRLIDTACAAMRDGDKGLVAQAISTFFDHLFAAAGNLPMLDIVRRLNVQFSVYVNLFGPREDLLEFPAFLHQTLDAIAAGDLPAAVAALSDYLDPDQVGDVEGALDAAWQRRDTIRPVRRVRLGPAIGTLQEPVVE